MFIGWLWHRGTGLSHLLTCYLRISVGETITHIQFFKIESQAAKVLLRVDDIVQATRKEKEQGGGAAAAQMPEDMQQE